MNGCVPRCAYIYIMSDIGVVAWPGAKSWRVDSQGMVDSVMSARLKILHAEHGIAELEARLIQL